MKKNPRFVYSSISAILSHAVCLKCPVIPDL